MQLVTFEDLLSVLGDSYIVFCGSAVSGFIDGGSGAQRFLPMVSDVTEKLYKELTHELRSSVKLYEITLAAYGDSLVAGKYAQLRQQIKFEEFLWQLGNSIGDSHLRSFLKALFLCEEAHFNHNHAAIATLLSSGTAAACITTNYDNGIECALPTIDVYVYSKPPSLETFERVPSLLKLHGDVISDTYIATLPEMFTARHDYLRELLRHRTVLVVGYSGYGDLDIAPYLEDLAHTAGTTFVWCFDRSQRPKVPPYATYGVGCDLRYNSAESNPLIDLAMDHGQPRTLNIKQPLLPWEARVDQWFREVGTEKLKEIIPHVSPISKGGWAWPYLHLHHVRYWQLDTKGRKETQSEIAWDRARACIDVGLYFSAEQALQEFKEARDTRTDDLSPLQEAELSFWMGFVAWRLGDFTAARDKLQIFHDLDLSKYPGGKELVAKGLRVYLEVADDLLRLYPNKKRRKTFYQEANLELWEVRLLEAYQDSTLQIDRRNQILGELAILNNHSLIEKPVDRERLRRLYQQSSALQDGLVAGRAARVLLQVDFWQGWGAIRENSRFLLQEQNVSHFIKNLVSVLFRLVPIRCWQVLNIDGPPLARPKTQAYEWIYHLYHLPRWRKAFSATRTLVI